MSTTERWLPIQGWPGYFISDLGRVKSQRPRWGGDRTPRFLSPGYGGGGYATVVLTSDVRPNRTHNVHSLVAEAFIGPRPDGLEVRHLDGDPANCQLSNLRHGTPSENAYDRVRHGTHGMARKTHCINGHPFAGSNLVSTPRQRRCRTCVNEGNRRYRERKALRAAGIAA